jgi:hypothetical protein
MVTVGPTHVAGDPLVIVQVTLVALPSERASNVAPATTDFGA